MNTAGGKKNHPSMLESRDANKYMIIAADNSLAGGLGLDLMHFHAASPLRPVAPGEKRYDVPIGDLPDAVRQRARGGPAVLALSLTMVHVVLRLHGRRKGMS